MAVQRSEIQLSTPSPNKHGKYKGPHVWRVVADVLPPFSVGQTYIEQTVKSTNPRSGQVNVDFYAERMYAGGLIDRVREWGIPGIFNRYLSRVILSTCLEVPKESTQFQVLPSRQDDAVSRDALVGACTRLAELTDPSRNIALQAMTPEDHVVNPTI